jgi:ketosteroid isomerase-like protein
MSEPNAKLVAAVVDAVGRRDLDRLLALTDPEVEWQSALAALIEGGVYRGHEGIRRYVADLETWELLITEVDDMLLFEDMVVLVARLHYRGKGSGVDSQMPIGYWVKVRGGRVLKMRVPRDPRSVLAALGEDDG